jgi:hypothetical protein
MYQSLVEGRQVPWDLLVKDVPQDKKFDLDYIIEQLDWERHVDPHFKESNYLEPIIDKACSGDGYCDKWITYGTVVEGVQLFSAKELTIMPGAKCTIKDPGASSWITVQGCGKMGDLSIETPVMIHYGEEPNDEMYITDEAAKNGFVVENTGSEPLVGLRYFGPETHKNLPNVGDYRK